MLAWYFVGLRFCFLCTLLYASRLRKLPSSAFQYLCLTSFRYSDYVSHTIATASRPLFCLFIYAFFVVARFIGALDTADTVCPFYFVNLTFKILHWVLAFLPIGWAISFIPMFPVFVEWAVEQAYFHFLGGTPSIAPLRLVQGAVASSMVASAVSFFCSF